MKNAIYKILKSNKGLYDFIFEKIIKDREIEAIKKLVGDKPVICKKDITGKDLDISNCILIDVEIANCNVNNLVNNVITGCMVTCNRIAGKIDIK